MELLVGVVASILGAAVVTGTGAVFASRRARIALARLVSSWSGQLNAHTYSSYENFLKDVERALRSASTIKILTGRGRFLERAGIAEGLALARQRKAEIRILLPCTRSHRTVNDWLAVNETELARLHPGYACGTLRKQIANTETLLSPYVTEGSLRVRHFNSLHMGKLILTDKSAFFLPYMPHSRADRAPAFMFDTGTDFYEWLERVFEVLWNADPRATNGLKPL